MSQDIRTVNDMESLMTYFSEKLNWDIDPDDFYDIDDITYDFEAEDLGLKEEAFAKISSLKQLRPLVDDQKWGIFFVEFDSKRFEVSALRKILSGLIPTRRNSADHAVWDMSDLLFLCTWGQGNTVTIGAAHFEDHGDGLPQIKMISCEPAIEDFTQINTFEQRLAKLHWPSDPDDTEGWQEQWSSAFTVRYRQVIQDSHTLTVRLAEEAQHIRDLILEILEIETQKGYVHQLFEKFKLTLIHDMTESQFADMYAQTIVYGLFSARCMDSSQEDFSAIEAVNCIPNTNPFLKSLMQECLSTKYASSALSFDELQISSIVELLQHTKTDAIVADFNRRTGGGREDPVIQFYEEFLEEYDKTQKVQRGVYYTPQPVVEFIIRAVDDILKSEFGITDGLASTETKQIKIHRQSKKKNKNGFYGEVEDTEIVPAVQVLDPATGTGTFLRQTILQIYQNFCSKHKDCNSTQLQAEWNSYVPEHLLPRLNGFELMMAPYAVAHMKLAMVLKDTGYNFDGNERLQVYLTNSLEKPGDSDAQTSLFSDPLAMESVEANAVKKNAGVNVIIGNPPYAGESSNNNDFALQLIDPYKKEPGGHIKLQEQNIKWINDDYVKFIRYAQSFTDNSSEGILAYINPHGFLDNPTFRGMRWNLLQSFSKLYILDLHGNAKKKELSPDGSKDENVFDIQQGVCIFIGVKKKSKEHCICKVLHADLYGLRLNKYGVLNRSSLSQIEWEEVVPAENDYLFIPRDTGLSQKWNTYFPIDKAFPINGVGICSKRDTIAYQNTKEQLLEVLSDFNTLSECEIKEKYDVKSESRDQKVSYAKDNVQSYGIQSQFLRQCLYRPFDLKWTYYTDKVRGFLAYPVYKILKHMLYDNIGMIISRQGQASDSTNWNVVFSTKNIVDLNIFRRGGGCLFPLYLYDVNLGTVTRRVNLDESILNNFSNRLGLRFSDADDAGTNYFSAKDFWYYIYAILHSTTYRDKYNAFLKLEFPRIPFIDDISIFRQLITLGKTLSEIHCMDDSCDEYDSPTLNPGINRIEKVSYKAGKVYVSKNQYFENISEKCWNFQIGGYQPLEKWLKDRRGQDLSPEEIKHYYHIVRAISKTIDVMSQIDGVIQF